MNKSRAWCFAVMVAGLASAAGCSSSSSGSGVDGSKKLVALSAAEVDTLCAWAVEVEHAPRTVDCGGGATVTLDAKEDCVSAYGALPAACSATVGQAETCFEALDRDPCHFGGASCAPLLSCIPTARGGGTAGLR